jgi:hypothetical protein
LEREWLTDLPSENGKYAGNRGYLSIYCRRKVPDTALGDGLV